MDQPFRESGSFELYTEVRGTHIASIGGYRELSFCASH